MSFALARQSKSNKETNSKSSTTVKPSFYQNSKLARGAQGSVLHSQRALGNQDMQMLARLSSNSVGFDFAKIGIQPKLQVSQPNDPYEQEADRMAEQVMRMQTANADKLIMANEGEKLDRKCASCELKDDEEKEGEISRKPSSINNGQTTDKIASEIDSVRAGGSALDSETREFMESRFGFDFGNVRIHTGAMADRSARSVNARAYTIGRDIVFANAQYAPTTDGGRMLLAHELTHVIQQNTERVSNTHMSKSAGTLQLRRSIGDLIEGVKSFLSEVEIAGKIVDGAIFNGNELLLVQGGIITNRFRAVSGQGGGEWEKNIGPIPDGDYTLQPHITNKKITKIERGTGGANAISSGYQEIAVTDEEQCDPAWAYCTIDCSAKFGAGAKCWNTTTVWGNHRLKIGPSAVRVTSPTGSVVTRTGFYIHGGAHSVNVTSGCIKVFDDAAFTELRKFKKKVSLVVKKR